LTQEKSHLSLIKNIRSNIFIILLSMLVIIMVFLTIDRVVFIQTTKKHIYEETLENQSKLVKNEVLIVANMIYHYADQNYDQKKVLDYLRKLRFGANLDDYIFVVTYDGTTLLNDTKRELEGVNIWDLEDPNGVKVIQEERKAAEKPNGDFIYYSWEQPSTGKVTPKISYIIGIPEWKWMVGTGVYLDSIGFETAKQVKQIYKNLFHQLAVILVLMTLLFFLIYLKFKKFTISVSKDIATINNCFKNSENNSSFFDNSELKYEEFSIIANQAQERIIRQQKAEKKMQYSESRLRLQQEQSPLAYIGWDLNNKVIEWNPAAEDMFGYSKEEALGKGFELIIPKDETTGVNYVFSNLAKTNNRKKHINQNITKDGHIITCEWYNNNLIDNNGNVLGIAAIGMDITRRLNSHKEIAEKNMELEKSLKEKNILIKEVHHRVKNNMALISSLLSLQSNEIEDKQLQYLLQSSQNRIQSMAMVHEHIYRNDNLHDIHVNTYMTELIEYLMISLGRIDHNISLNIDIEDINLELDTLIPLGMLVNEIISNSFKYAFNGEGKFELSVILKSIEDNKFYLYIADNGPGFNSTNNSQKQGSIGLKLIKGLVEQIDGRVKIITENKTAYEIYF